MSKYFTGTIVVLFLILSVVFYSMKFYAPAYQYQVLILGNAVMALLCIATFAMVKKQLNNRPEAFVRSVSSSSFLKLIVCMVAILVYVMINKPNIHKPSVFMLMGIYLVYTIVETLILSKMARTTN